MCISCVYYTKKRPEKEDPCQKKVAFTLLLGYISIQVTSQVRCCSCCWTPYMEKMMYDSQYFFLAGYVFFILVFFLLTI
jgi:hypothetical protein